jgi:hypothetical protein
LPATTSREKCLARNSRVFGPQMRITAIAAAPLGVSIITWFDS